MRTREEAANLIYRQFDATAPTSEDYGPKVCWHYGRLELRELLDFIYGGPPARKAEEIQ